MTPDLLVALVLFAFVSSITPGPNNVMLMASGANFGFRRTLPHMLGVSLGFAFMIAVIGVGLGRVFDAWPVSYTVLRVLSVLYLLFLAWKIATAAPVERNAEGGTPLTFLQAAGFQWVNPKAWAMALTAISAYTPDHAMATLVLVAGVFAVANLPSVSAWAMLGQQMARFLTNPVRLAVFNRVMAALLVVSLYPVLMP